MTKALKWIAKDQKYIPYVLPEGASCFESDMEKEIACCKCGRIIKYGECYTSREIHTEMGIGYGECGDCYFGELLK